MDEVNELIKIRIDKIDEIRNELKINPYPYNYDQGEGCYSNKNYPTDYRRHQG